MKTFALQRRLASSIMSIGKTKVTFKTDALEEIGKAITRDDVKNLIQKGLIYKSNSPEQSKVRVRKRLMQKRKGRRNSIGSRKGSKNARLNSKTSWISRIRIQRNILKTLRQKNVLSKENYHDLYKKSKGGFFRSRRHLKLYLSEHNLTAKEENGKKQKK